MLNSSDFDIYESSRRLRDLRKKTKTSLDTLASAIGVSKQVLINYELACRYQDCPENLQPSKTDAIAGMGISTLYKIAQYFHVSADYLLGTNNTSDPDETLRFALFGGDAEYISDEAFEDVKRFAQIVAEKEKAKRNGK